MMDKKRINTNIHPTHLFLKRNGHFPNNTLPVVVYQESLRLPKQKNKSAEIAQQVFIRNGWSNSWRNGIYDFHHYHSNTHECMAVCMGTATVMLGGPGGRKIKLKAGDVLLLPAGVAHKCHTFSSDFLCVGAYPNAKDYDMNFGTAAELKSALKKIRLVPKPVKDPVYGKEGFLKMYWK
jgi:uncharacterized protein YjlB